MAGVGLTPKPEKVSCQGSPEEPLCPLPVPSTAPPGGLSSVHEDRLGGKMIPTRLWGA